MQKLDLDTGACLSNFIVTYFRFLETNDSFTYVQNKCQI